MFFDERANKELYQFSSQYLAISSLTPNSKPTSRSPTVTFTLSHRQPTKDITAISDRKMVVRLAEEAFLRERKEEIDKEIAEFKEESQKGSELLESP